MCAYWRAFNLPVYTMCMFPILLCILAIICDYTAAEVPLWSAAHSLQHDQTSDRCMLTLKDLNQATRFLVYQFNAAHCHSIQVELAQISQFEYTVWYVFIFSKNSFDITLSDKDTTTPYYRKHHSYTPCILCNHCMFHEKIVIVLLQWSNLKVDDWMDL